MNIRVCDTKVQMGKEAAAAGAKTIQEHIDTYGRADIILATGASQFEMLGELVRADIDWKKVHCFHLDEYAGITVDHPASFCKYLKERFVDQVEALGSFNFIRPDLRPPEEECVRLGEIIKKVNICVAFIGIGENGHLAFNDPPADFNTREPYILVKLDEDCRKQQFGEGWFKRLEDVPEKAVSMSIRQIMKSGQLIVTVPDSRKAKAVKCAVEGEITPECPSSILQKHQNCHLFLDRDSSSLLTGR